MIFTFCTHGYSENIKEPNVAGAFYPGNPEELRGAIQQYLKGAKEQKLEGEPLVLIAPHAGYVYSGPVAAYGFKALEGKKFDTVVVLAASHYFGFRGVSVYKEGYFKTPLGEIEIDKETAEALIESDPGLLFFGPAYFEKEHSLEVELPFLQAVLSPGFKIVPVLFGPDVSFEECRSLARDMSVLTRNKNVFVVASTDLSHYRAYGEAVALDNKTIAFIKSSDAQGLWNAVAGGGENLCGVKPVVTGMLYAGLSGADRVQVLQYANSGDTAGTKDRVVGYVSAVFLRTAGEQKKKTGPPAATVLKEGEDAMLTMQDKKRLLEIARAALEAHCRGQQMPVFMETGPGLNLKRGLFVTLRKHNALRGCIGIFSSDESLCQAVPKMSIESASHDYRFAPVEAGELKDIKIEISVLSEPRLIDDWKKIRLGTDGVIVRRGYSSGVFLPQVATETGWDLETFLGELCQQKVGLPRRCYEDPGTKIYTFEADIFSEEELK